MQIIVHAGRPKVAAWLRDCGGGTAAGRHVRVPDFADGVRKLFVIRWTGSDEEGAHQERIVGYALVLAYTI